MNGEIEGMELTPEAGPLENAREIYTQYASAVASDRFSSQQTEELIAEAENHEAAASDHAQLCADLGFPERTVGFLERSNLSEADRLSLLAQAEDVSAAHALRMAISMTQEKRHTWHAKQIEIVKGAEAGARRRRAQTLREGAKELPKAA